MDTEHPDAARPTPTSARALSNGALVGEITSTAARLVRKEIELAKAEIRADLRAQVGTVAAFAVAVVAILFALDALLVAVILTLGLLMAGWLAALLVTGVLLATAAVAGYLGWRRLAITPLARTRQRLKEDVRWMKEHLG